VRKLLLDRKPKSLRVCAMLDKPERHKVDFPIDYLGFSIPDYFVSAMAWTLTKKGAICPTSPPSIWRSTKS